MPQIFEMPTGGAAIMRQGPNLLKLARKEQCLALLTQLRTKFKIDGFIYRVFPNGEVQYLHPKVSGAGELWWRSMAGSSVAGGAMLYRQSEGGPVWLGLPRLDVTGMERWLLKREGERVM